MFVHVHQRDALRMGHASNVPVMCDLGVNLNRKSIQALYNTELEPLVYDATKI